MKVVTEILQDLEILKRLLKHNANLKIRINYYFTLGLMSYFKTRLSRKNERSRSSVHRKMAAINELMRYSGANLLKQVWFICLFDGMN